MIQSLKYRKFKEPLDKLEIKYRFRDTKGYFHSHFQKYHRKLEQLFIINNRIVDSLSIMIESFKISEIMIENKKRLDRGENILDITSKVQKVNKKGRPNALLLLDVEDFFLHARILMDYITHLTVFFFEDKPHIGNQYASFNKHKKWLKNENPSGVPIEYKQYILEKTDWFDNVLTFIRDKYVRHDLHPRFLMFKKTKKDEISVVYGFLSLTEKQYDGLKKIEMKYADKIPSLKNISKSNVYEMVDFFNYNPTIESLLEEKDRNIITNIKIRGGEFPDIGNLMDQILYFLDFFNDFFISYLFTTLTPLN